VTGWLVLLPTAAAARIAATGSGWGHLTVTASRPHLLAAVTGVGDRNQTMFSASLGLPAGHPLAAADEIPLSALWYRVDPVLHTRWQDCRMRVSGLPTMIFRDLVIRGWVALAADRQELIVTYAPGGQPEWAAWWADRNHAFPADLDLPGAPGLGWEQLEPGWPVDRLRPARITVVGAGSIGSAAAHGLGAYGVGTIALVDPDRLLAHNLVRHQLTARHLGLMKVDGLADQLRSAWPEMAVEPFPVDVARDADRMRPLFDSSALIVCAADGVIPRRVVSHLARRASVPAVLACVLEDGEIGEIIRLLPWPTAGCLACHRQYLAETGGFDPEPALDLPYRTGNGHRPMAAVAGDLQLVGQLAAKITVATLLEHAGYHDQILPGDHLVAGLRPGSGLPPPADVRRAAEFRWSRVGPPLPGCPTCDPVAVGRTECGSCITS
jgi:molybdopterin-synthase adenylyltransferase